jgi:hypothetical protein
MSTQFAEPTVSTGVIDGGLSPAVSAETPQADPPVGGENIATSEAAVTAPESEAPAQPEFTIPENDDDLKGQEHNPHVQSLIQQRQHIRQLSQQLNELKPLESWKPLVELDQPDALRAAYEQRQKLFSPVVNQTTQQVEYDERGLQRRTSHPWLDDMEKETPGFVPRHFDDLLRYEYTDANGQKSNMAQVYFKGIGLDIERYDDYLNIDKLLAQTNGGVVTEAELANVAEPDRDAYKLLPSSLRRDWANIEPDEQKWHLNSARNQLRLEQAEKQQQEQAQQQQQQFQAKLQSDVMADLTKVRTDGLTSLRDSLTKAVQLSADANVNGAYIDAIIAPLALLLSPDFSDLGAHMLDSMGVKLDASFNDALSAFVTARQEHVIAKAYGDEGAARSALKEADGKFARIMAKFNDLALKRAQTFGYQAKQIATANGDALAAASAVRAMPGNGSAVEAAAGILPSGMDPYSPQANTHLWNQTQQRGQ